MFWLFMHLKFVLAYLRRQNTRKPSGHSKGRSVMDYPEIAQRLRYYRRGRRTYNFYTGGYSRLVSHG